MDTEKVFKFLNYAPYLKGGVDAIELTNKIKVLRAISLILFITSGISVIFRLTILKTPFENVATISTFTLFFFVFYLLFRKINKVGAITHIFMSSYFLMITVRMIQGGGIHSPNVYVYTLFCICMFVVYGNFWGKVSILTCFAIMGITLFTQLNYPGLIPNPDNTLFAYGILVFMAFLYVTFPLQYIFDEKVSLTNALRKYEKRESSNVIMRRFAHEIGNALQVAIGNLDYPKSEDNVPDTKLVKDKLYEIDALVKTMSKMANTGDLVDFLKKNEDVIKILKLDSE